MVNKIRSDVEGCPRHCIGLRKHRTFDGSIVYSCPKEKCGHKKNEDGKVLTL